MTLKQLESMIANVVLEINELLALPEIVTDREKDILLKYRESLMVLPNIEGVGEWLSFKSS
jgi:hypothetical protein